MCQLQIEISYLTHTRLALKCATAKYMNVIIMLSIRIITYKCVDIAVDIKQKKINAIDLPVTLMC